MCWRGQCCHGLILELILIFSDIFNCNISFHKIYFIQDVDKKCVGEAAVVTA